jgi:2-haloacid dehalogenase
MYVEAAYNCSTPGKVPKPAGKKCQRECAISYSLYSCAPPRLTTTEKQNSHPKMHTASRSAPLDKAFHGVYDDTALSRIKALVFDTFGTVVDWRSSLISELSEFGHQKGVVADWILLTDEWRAAYYPSMERVRKGELPWTTLDALHRQSLELLVTQLGVSGLTAEDLDELTDAWRRLHPWPDVLEGMQRLSTRYLLGPLSNANLALMIRLRRFAGLPWDFVFGADLWQHYKPAPEAYLGACRLLGLPPHEVMLVAAHNYDLRAARSQGLGTAFIPRPTEYGPRQQKDFAAEEAWTVVASDLRDLASLLST